uniref:Uncharacterized protein n=1 Tax=Phocoena sinus TaxID=42100 RepID=A0A8C9C9D5_PHOSS
QISSSGLPFGCQDWAISLLSQNKQEAQRHVIAGNQATSFMLALQPRPHNTTGRQVFLSSFYRECNSQRGEASSYGSYQTPTKGLDLPVCKTTAGKDHRGHILGQFSLFTIQESGDPRQNGTLGTPRLGFSFPVQPAGEAGGGVEPGCSCRGPRVPGAVPGGRAFQSLQSHPSRACPVPSRASWPLLRAPACPGHIRGRGPRARGLIPLLGPAPSEETWRSVPAASTPGTFRRPGTIQQRRGPLGFQRSCADPG